MEKSSSILYHTMPWLKDRRLKFRTWMEIHETTFVQILGASSNVIRVDGDLRKRGKKAVQIQRRVPCV